MWIVEFFLRRLCLLCTSLFSIVFFPKDSSLSRKSASQRQLCKWGGFSTSAHFTLQNGFPFIALTHWCWSNLAVSAPICWANLSSYSCSERRLSAASNFGFFHIPITQQFSRGRLKMWVIRTQRTVPFIATRRGASPRWTDLKDHSASLV